MSLVTCSQREHWCRYVIWMCFVLLAFLLMGETHADDYLCTFKDGHHGPNEGRLYREADHGGDFAAFQACWYSCKADGYHIMFNKRCVPIKAGTEPYISCACVCDDPTATVHGAVAYQPPSHVLSCDQLCAASCSDDKASCRCQPVRGPDCFAEMDGLRELGARSEDLDGQVAEARKRYHEARAAWDEWWARIQPFLDTKGGAIAVSQGLGTLNGDREKKALDEAGEVLLALQEQQKQARAAIHNGYRALESCQNEQRARMQEVIDWGRNAP